MNQADLRPSPFLAALGFMNLFRGAVNSFFANLEKTFCRAFPQSGCDNRRRWNLSGSAIPVKNFFALAAKFPRGRFAGPWRQALAEAPEQSRRAVPWRGEALYAHSPSLSTKK